MKLLELTSKHPADIASQIGQINNSELLEVFIELPSKLSTPVFEELETEQQIYLINNLESKESSQILQAISAPVLVTIFENLSEESLGRYLKQTQRKRRQAIIASLECKPETAGRLLNSELLTLQKDFTVKKSISLMQRLGKGLESKPWLYVKDEELRLAGYIEMHDLVLNKPETPLSNIMRKVAASANVKDDQEKVANLLKHYSMPSIPVVDDDNRFLGIISSQDAIEVVEEEMEEDAYKMSGLAANPKQDFWIMVWQRSSWLVPLLVFQSVSGIILEQYQGLLEQNTILVFFITMLIGTGGNAGNQSSSLVVRGLVTGEINKNNFLSVIAKEFGISLAIGAILFVISVIRVLMFGGSMINAIAIALSLLGIVITSVMLGTIIPILLDKIGIDPAHSAAPFLATLMDVIGIIMYCTIAGLVLGSV
jgi:magnesium transporter